eukprot:5205953-Ditylum_brightwellii.AAC.1
MKTYLVKVIKNVHNNYVKAICPFREDDRKLKFKGILGNGTTELITEEWLKENFSSIYTVYFDELHDENYLDFELAVSE